MYKTTDMHPRASRTEREQGPGLVSEGEYSRGLASENLEEGGTKATRDWRNRASGPGKAAAAEAPREEAGEGKGRALSPRRGP